MDLEIVGEGRTTKVYRDGDKAIKLYVNAPPDEAYDEAQRQTFAVESGLPVPKVLGVRQLQEGIALEMEYIQGTELIRPRMAKADRMIAFEQFVELQHTIHHVNADGQPMLSERLAWKIKQAPRLSDEQIRVLLNRLNALDNGKTNLCHGDFHPLNIIDDGKKLWIIDWVDAACGDPLADACRSYLLFRQYISRMAGVYLRLFCKTASVHQEDVLAWLPIVAAGRLSENLNDTETNFIMDIVHTNIAS
jgi:aminoglycoside phosphotransferase